MASGAAPASSAIVVAAATSDSRWRPISCTSLTGSTGTSARPGARDTIQPPTSTVPCSSGCSSENRQHRGRRPPRREAHRRRIVRVDDRPVPRALVREHARLRGGVLAEVRVPVQVVGREVQQRRDPRVERLGRLELEAADFDDVDRLVGRRVHLRRKRVADVPGHGRRQPSRREHPADQRRGRGLPLRAGDRDDPAAQQARRQLDLAGDRNLRAAGPRQDRLAQRHSRAEHDQVGRREQLRVVRAEREVHALRGQRGGLGQLGLQVGQRHARAAARQERGGRHAAPRGPDDDDPLAFDLQIEHACHPQAPATPRTPNPADPPPLPS